MNNNIDFCCLSDKYKGSFFKITFTSIINSAGGKNVSAAWLFSAIIKSIPALTFLRCAEKQLAPAIIYAEVNKFLHARNYRADDIIQSITIWSKCSWYKYWKALFQTNEFLYYHCLRTPALLILLHDK